jgi:hypothetical protein
MHFLIEKVYNKPVKGIDIFLVKNISLDAYWKANDEIFFIVSLTTHDEIKTEILSHLYEYEER